jgi:hypothetical protein
LENIEERKKNGKEEWQRRMQKRKGEIWKKMKWLRRNKK